jgi:predicted MFS family arabinose efflux permease
MSNADGAAGMSAPTTRALRVLSLAYFVQATGALAVVGSLDVISRQWGLADSQTAYLISVFGITFAFAAPLLQVAFGRLGRRRQVLLGLLLFSGAALLFAVAPGYPALLLSRILMGLGAAFIGPVLGALGSSLVERKHQGSAIAIVLLGLSIANLAGLPMSAWIGHVWGARALFLIVSVAGIATAALIRWQVPDQSAGEPVRLATVTSLLTKTETLSAFLVVFFITSSVYSTYSFIAPIVHDVFHAGPGIVSLALMVIGVAGVVGNLFVAHAARRHSAEKMLLVGLGLLGADIVFLWVMPARLHWLFVALTAWAFATDMLWPSQQRRIVELMPHLRGIALALSASFVFCGIGLGSAVAGWVYPVFGYSGVLGSSILFLVLATASLAVSRASVKTAREPVCPPTLESR